MMPTVELLFRDMDFSNSITSLLKADPDIRNHTRQVLDSFYSPVDPTPVSKPSLIAYSKQMAVQLGLDHTQVQSTSFTQIFSGNALHREMSPYSSCYGGHQFGHWAGQLGDGRAISLCELKHGNHRYELQLKGAGPTPYSRMGDGRAVLRSSIREYLCSEAMHHLGVPTTRALSLIKTGDEVVRDMFYDGNSKPEHGAIVCRVAASFLRFGSFEIFMARRQPERIMELVNYLVETHLQFIKSTGKQRVIDVFHWVCRETALLISKWMGFGFVHGVMNTDNMSILGLTIDYGPYGWLDNYDPEWTPNTTDLNGRRYCYGNQPHIAMWNLSKLADAFYPLLHTVEPLQDGIELYANTYEAAFNDIRAAKLGLLQIKGEPGNKTTPPKKDRHLLYQLYELMSQIETDMTLFYRTLTDSQPLFDTPDFQEDELVSRFEHVFYQPLSEVNRQKVSQWLKLYKERLVQDGRKASQRMLEMSKANPCFILRNWIVQMAIEKAEIGDYNMIHEIQSVLENPFDPSGCPQEWSQKRPEWARHKAGCSMLSCSS